MRQSPLLLRLQNPRALLIAVAGAVALVVLFLVLRPGGGEDGEPAPAAPVTSTEQGTGTGEETTEGETTTEAAPPPPPAPTTFRVTIEGGRPAGGVQRFSAQRGDRVVLVVRSDVADHVHVHGYDLFADVAPGAPARLAFRANLTGRFEIELEDSHVPIAELEVTP